jgi:hypothetical protein
VSMMLGVLSEIERLARSDLPSPHTGKYCISQQRQVFRGKSA